jgi:hypothetical protein
MNRNQKIALGCGGGGCLIVILIVVGVVIAIATGVIKAPGLTSYTDSDSNTNSNSNYNSNDNSNSNSSVSNRNSNSSSSSSSMTDDDKHRLFQAAAASQDADLTRRVSDKLDLLKPDGTPNDNYVPFFKDHLRWIFKNTAFIQNTINTPEKARDYVNQHIDD